jgi:hypothetical protein
VGAVTGLRNEDDMTHVVLIGLEDKPEVTWFYGKSYMYSLERNASSVLSVKLTDDQARNH